MSTDIDIAQITETLNDKADIGLGNTVDHLTDSAKEYFAKIGMPSTRVVNLTLPSSGESITAPADGWLEIRKSGSDQQYIKITAQIETCGSASGSNVIALFVPMKKGDTAALNYTASGTTHVFRFVYAEGEK